MRQAHLARGLCTRHYSEWKRRNPNAPRKYPGREDCFRGTRLEWLEHHADYNGDECLIWPFSRCKAGYGNIYFQGRRTRASRAMCQIASGPPPAEDGYEAAHSCGRGHLGCVHPKHLRWASIAENNAEKILHGTWCHGEDVHSAVLTEAQVREIRSLTPALSHSEIAKRFGVSRPAISAIISRKSWGWLT